MNLTKLFLSTFCALIALNSYALDFTAGLGQQNKTLMFSNCEMKDWGADRKLPGRPAGNDKLRVVGNNTLEFDSNVTISVLDLWGAATASMKKLNNMKINKEVLFIVGNSKEVASIYLKNSKLNLGGGVRVSCHGGSRQLGKAKIELDDSSMYIKRNLVSGFPIDGNANFFNNGNQRGGIILSLKGKSLLEIDGSISHDSLIKENSKDAQFKIVLTENDGFVPTIKFGKVSNLASVDLEINVKNSLSKGTYTLVEMEMRKESAGKFRSLTLNGKPAALGDTFDTAGKTATLKLAPTKSATAKDKSTANDLVIEVK